MRKYLISILIVALMVTIGVDKIQSQTEVENKYNVNNQIEIVQIEEPEPTYIIMKATAYDLSIQSCGKSYSSPSRGKTTDGYNLTNKSHSEAWVVSSNRFPMGTKLQLEFPESHKKYDGVYTVRDTGNFRSNVLDIYLGDFGEKVGKDTVKFGRVDVKVMVVE
jgi:3D (Asp-Asp-Asp) domain-containing protein